jgi:hypothetical protein
MKLISDQKNIFLVLMKKKILFNTIHKSLLFYVVLISYGVNLPRIEKMFEDRAKIIVKFTDNYRKNLIMS